MNALPRILAAIAGGLALILVLAWFAGVFTPTIAPGRPGAGTAETDSGGQWVAVVRRAQPRIETATGTVRAGYETLISARITATVRSAPKRAGASVVADEVLFELDAREAEARVAQAEEARASARARAEDARRTARRMETLVQRGAVAVSERDSAAAALAVAEAELQRAEDALDEARTARSYSTVRAPFDARLVDRLVDAGDTVMPGTPLARLYDPARLRLEANVRESLVDLLRTLDTLEVRVDALDRPVRGQVEEIVPAADPGSRTFLVKVGLPAALPLFPGMFGRLAIPVGTEERFLIPETAIQRVGQLAFVQVQSDGGVQRRHVRTGPRTDGGLIEVRSGLGAGERVRVPAEI